MGPESGPLKTGPTGPVATALLTEMKYIVYIFIMMRFVGSQDYLKYIHYSVIPQELYALWPHVHIAQVRTQTPQTESDFLIIIQDAWTSLYTQYRLIYAGGGGALVTNYYTLDTRCVHS